VDKWDPARRRRSDAHEGYPPLFLGNGLATQVLVEIGAAEPSPLTWLGSPLRTLAIIRVSQLEEVDESTIARGCAVKTQRAMLALLRPIERDRLFGTSVVGKFRICRLADSPWTDRLRPLTGVIADVNGNVGATVRAARQARTGAEHHSRAFLARYLRDGVVSYKDPGRKRRVGE
jgi:hypothetical protein